MHPDPDGFFAAPHSTSGPRLVEEAIRAGVEGHRADRFASRVVRPGGSGGAVWVALEAEPEPPPPGEPQGDRAGEPVVDVEPSTDSAPIQLPSEAHRRYASLLAFTQL